MTDEDLEREPEPIPDPDAAESNWRIVQLVAAPPGWHALSGRPDGTKALKRPIAVWVLLAERESGRQTIRGYVDALGQGGALVDAQAADAQAGREWWGYALEAPPQPGKDDEV